MESQIARDKGDDMRDISIRLHNALTGITIHSLETIPDNCVLATSRLLPSDTIFLAGRSIAAVLLEHGSAGSHAALFAREMGLPAISGLVNLFGVVSEGVFALVNADSGLITLRPSAHQSLIFQENIEHNEQVLQEARKHAQSPAITNGADGIGLYRIEQAYLGRTVPPNKEELLIEMQETLAAAKGYSVCVRLLDIGADKPLPFLGFMAETNPALGRRGIRLLREYPELLKTQLAAILELSSDFDIRLLVPMVTLPTDVLVVKEALIQLGKTLNLSQLPQLGVMIETPAAALSAKVIGRHVDFLSFGTNDLTQYAFAADRENAAVEEYIDDASPVILRLLEIVHDDVPEMPLSLCGELAGRTEHMASLVRSGIGTLSVAAPLIPMVKEAIRCV
jgi:phosphoenolpyruvate-protein kinase (PTS system EI component)